MVPQAKGGEIELEGGKTIVKRQGTVHPNGIAHGSEGEKRGGRIGWGGS